jgi:methionyl-tRNA formyltransferase
MALKIIFMGTPEFSVPIFKSIYETDNKILEVYTQPPKKKNRGQKIINSPIHEYSKKFRISVRNPIVFDDEEINHIENLKPDLVIVVAYGKILPKKLLNLEDILFINVHASLLPKWRGAAPIQRAIMNMDQETGVSIMKIVPKLDAGPVLIQSKIKITKETNHKELSGKMSELGAKLILDSLKLIENKKVNFIEQNESNATYAKKIEKTETRLNWNDDADKVIAKINAFCPSPGCWFELNGIRIKIIKAKRVINQGMPGTVLDDKLTIACSKNAIQVIELQKEGKQKITADEFLRGNTIKTGQSLN